MKKYLDESKRLKEKEIKKELWQFGNFFFKIRVVLRALMSRKSHDEELQDI